MEKNFPNEPKPLRPGWKSNKIFSSLFSFKRITVHPERSDPNDSPENRNIQILDQNPTIFLETQQNLKIIFYVLLPRLREDPNVVSTFRAGRLINKLIDIQFEKMGYQLIN